MTAIQVNNETNKWRNLQYKEDREGTLNLESSLDKEEAKVKELFRLTMAQSNYKIVSIDKVKFDTETKKTQLAMYEQLLKSNSILMKWNKKMERILFHGTSQDVIVKIMHNGFNRDFNKNAVYGKGVYFAKNANYSHSYCTPNSNDEYYMLACRVIVGDYCIGRNGMNTIPFKSDGVTQYDSLVDKLSNPSIFVISRDYHCIPYYLIKYKCNNVRYSNLNQNIQSNSYNYGQYSGVSRNYSNSYATTGNYVSSAASNTTPKPTSVQKKKNSCIVM